MKAIQKIKKSLRTTKKVLRGIFGAYERDRRSAAPATAGGRDSVSEKHLLGGIVFVLRHGILSLYSYIRKFIPWRSRTSTSNTISSVSSSRTTITVNTTSSISSYIRSLRNIRVAGLSSSFLLGLLALAIIIPLYNVSGTEDTEAATGTAIDSSITFTSTRNTATVDLTPTSASGTFASSTSGTTDAAFSITTTNSQGYTLKLKSSNGTALKTSTSATDTATLSAITSSGIASSSFTANTWGYLPSYYNSSANTTKYYPATTSEVTLRTTTAANSTAHSYTIGIGTKADLTREAGTYTLGGNSSSMVLTYVANPTVYSIAYDKGEATSDPSNMPSTQSGSVSATSVALSSNAPTLTGYTFTGWCLGEVNRSSAEVDSCTGTNAKTFAAGGTFGIDRTSTNSVTLHAMWSKASVNVIVNFAGSGVTSVTFTNTTYGNVTVSTSGNTAALKYGVQYDITGTYSSGYEFSSWSATAGSLGSTTTASTTYSATTAATLTLTGKASCGNMQDYKFSTLSALLPNTGDSVDLCDSRDGNAYKVAKLADGNIWMLDNLALDLVAKKDVLSSSNTNATDTELGYLKNGGGSTSDKYATSGVIAWPLYYSSSYSVPLATVSGYTTNGGTWDLNTTVTSYGSGSGKVGGYYNYCAASAGTYCYGNGTSYGTPSGNATADICPKGWRMPTGGDSGEYQALYTAYSSDVSNFKTALSTPLSGYFHDGSAYEQGSYGYFWSSTRYNNYSNHDLFVLPSNVNAASGSSRRYGNPVRCVMTPPTELYP